MAKKQTVLENPDIKLSQHDSVKAVNIIKEAVSHLAFLGDTIAMGRCTADDVRTHMSLYRFKFDDLSNLLDNGETISRTVDERTAELRAANQRIHELEQAVGEKISPEAVISGFKSLCDAFDTWYSLVGFHYAETTYHVNAVAARLSYEIDPDDGFRTQVTFGSRQLAEVLAPYTEHAFKTGWDMGGSRHKDCLLDTDNNRTRMKQLLTSVFPNSRVTGFASIRDGDDFLLRTEAYVPFADIAAWKQACLGKAFAAGTVRTGRLYLRRSELTHALSSDIWLQYNTEKDIKTAREELTRVGAVISEYERLMSVEDAEDRDRQLARFEKEHGVSVKADLEGDLYG